MCETCGCGDSDLVPVDEAEQLLVHGISPDGSGEAEFEALGRQTRQIDTEALTRFVTRDRVPYVSASYSAALTDAAGTSGRQGVEATPFNFFYGPSYSDALRAEEDA